jgi:hypothetical protein
MLGDDRRTIDERRVIDEVGCGGSRDGVDDDGEQAKQEASGHPGDCDDSLG